jgi:IS5 family transposase
MAKYQAARGFFDEEETLQKLSKLKDPLLKLNDTIDFEIFRDSLSLIYEKQIRKSNAGAKPFDYVMMFKILILQRLYNLSDEQIEFQLNDRISFKRFVGLAFSHRVPDCNTVWMFKQSLAKDDNGRKLFDKFYDAIKAQGLIVNQGKAIDASFHEAPRQRNSKDDNKIIKEDGIPTSFNDKPNVKRHKDTDARWTKKNNEAYYGYKNHVKSDLGSKLIDDYKVTSASVHDSQALADLLDANDKGQPLYADSAYASEEIEGMVAKAEMENQIHEKGYKGKPLTQEQKDSNTIKSKQRSRAEHIFGFIENTMKGTLIRTIGIARAKMNIALTNLTYNMCRVVQLKKIMCPVG